MSNLTNIATSIGKINRVNHSLNCRKLQPNNCYLFIMAQQIQAL